MPLPEQIVEFLRANGPTSDGDLARAFGKHHSHVHGTTRRLEARGRLIRQPGPDGVGLNRLADSGPLTASPQVMPPGDRLGEDDLKRHLEQWLTTRGWRVSVAYGKRHGVDVEAFRDSTRWLIEAKGDHSTPAVRVNYFVAALGETLQRMSDPNALYSLALPDISAFRGLWERLPSLAKERANLTALFVDHSGGVTEVR